ncbi:COG5429 Uncharacterized secreted protein [Rhabdaerophilaceae bacterium]
MNVTNSTFAQNVTRRSFCALGAAGLLLPGQLAAQQNAERPIVVELFTSQGCSSCPPADALMLRLASDPGIIPLTFATEIWDYLGWRDTLAKPAFTRRHKAYAAAVANRRVYTPQAIMNGRAHCVGSDINALNRLKRASAGTSASSRFAVTAVEQDWLLNLQRSEAAPARVLLLAVTARQDIEIKRGENAGRRITYANVVRDVIDIGPAPNVSGELRIKRAQLTAAGADSFAVIVQAGSIEAPGAISGAAFVGPGGVRA